ncbi:tryptophan synthase subunit beta [Chlamydia trachomatis]|nr:tryptophan synthase subunit beta [Chlamydia trachomatis]
MTVEKGFFGQFGGSFVPEPIQALLDELETTFETYKNDSEFLEEYQHYVKDYSGRETPLYFAESLTNHLGCAKIYLKREDLNRLGSHKLNNVLGSAVGPHPYPSMVHEFQKVISIESRR